jgi:anti-anti-sigma factor
MKITERRAHGYYIIELSERLTIRDDLDRVVALLEQAIKNGEKEIAIGLRTVTYLDSTGSAQLIVCYNLARQAGVRLRFLSPSPHVSKTFEITKLDTIFDIVDEDRLPKVDGGLKE